MLNMFTSPDRLPFISGLKSRQEAKINNLINNLKIDDVRLDTNFKKITEQIINTIQITPLVFDEPKFIDYKYEEKKPSLAQQISEISKDWYIHKVSMTFTGNSILLDYKPMSYSSGFYDHGILNKIGNSFIIHVDLAEINPQKAVTEAKNLMGMTLTFAKENSAEIANWNISVASIIEQKMNAKRQELI